MATNLSPANDSSKALGRLWLRWTQQFLHDMRASGSVASGYARMLRHAPDHPQKQRMLADLVKAIDGMLSTLSVADVCSRHGSLADVVTALTTHEMIVNREGDVAIAQPSEHLGFILSLMLRARERSNTRIDVRVTDSTGRIAIAPAEAPDMDTWERYDGDTEAWWFSDAVEHLRMSGCHVDARHRGDMWSIVLSWKR